MVILSFCSFSCTPQVIADEDGIYATQGEEELKEDKPEN